MLYGCSSLTYIPNPSNWNISPTSDINMMFAYCYSLKSIPFFSKRNYNNYNNMQTINNNNESDNKIYVKNSIRNDILKYIPQIEMKFNYVNKFNQNTIIPLNKEIKALH